MKVHVECEVAPNLYTAVVLPGTRIFDAECASPLGIKTFEATDKKIWSPRSRPLDFGSKRSEQHTDSTVHRVSTSLFGADLAEI
jgi:hypothetical protein